ncbi:MAG TPA: phenylalanine--tRNA ligase subunit alpha, partial [Gaiellaceae bacterium]|nr:phenylalanine--tRNA ligase subunit alpha [Gaiellaceae bacterium]
SLFGPERETRIATHFFPFTEPSIEAYVSCFLCDGAGCRVCRQSGWIEIGGAGMVDPNVFEFVGYDAEEVTGFAFGWGLERMALLRHGLPDIRALWENDLRLLEQF